MTPTWQVVIPGQPASGNDKGIRNRYRTTKDGGTVRYPQIANRPEVETYINGAIPIMRTARPSGWRHDGGLLRVVYELYLARDMDCDNISKTVGDALARAIDVDDKHFMPTFAVKVSGVRDPYVRLTIGPFELCGTCGR